VFQPSFEGCYFYASHDASAKLHRVRVTQADLNYEGSCGIDEALLEVSGLRPFQIFELYNISNGERFSTYIIRAPRGSGEISLNGAAARRAMVGDLLIICAIPRTAMPNWSAISLSWCLSMNITVLAPSTRCGPRVNSTKTSSPDSHDRA